MTRKEWIREHYPVVVSDRFVGGVRGCPGGYSTLALVDKSISQENSCLQACKEIFIEGTCAKCWNKEMEVAQ